MNLRKRRRPPPIDAFPRVKKAFELLQKKKDKVGIYQMLKKLKHYLEVCFGCWLLFKFVGCWLLLS